MIASFSVVGRGDIDDISINPSDGLMYASANAGGTGDRLVRIDVSNGAVMDIAPFGVDDIEGLSFDDSGQLWGTTGTAALPGEQNSPYEISLTTGAAVNRRPLDNGSDYESVACHKTLSATPTPTSTPRQPPQICRRREAPRRRPHHPPQRPQSQIPRPTCLNCQTPALRLAG